MTLGSATWALTEAGPRGWTDPAVLAGGFIAVLGGATFVYRMLHTMTRWCRRRCSAVASSR